MKTYKAIQNFVFTLQFLSRVAMFAGAIDLTVMCIVSFPIIGSVFSHVHTPSVYTAIGSMADKFLIYDFVFFASMSAVLLLIYGFDYVKMHSRIYGLLLFFVTIMSNAVLLFFFGELMSHWFLGHPWIWAVRHVFIILSIGVAVVLPMATIFFVVWIACAIFCIHGKIEHVRS